MLQKRKWMYEMNNCCPNNQAVCMWYVVNAILILLFKYYNTCWCIQYHDCVWWELPVNTLDLHVYHCLCNIKVILSWVCSLQCSCSLCASEICNNN